MMASELQGFSSAWADKMVEIWRDKIDLLDAIDTGTPVVYLTDACSGSSEEYENMATAMLEFASPTHTAVMTCEEYAALRQA